MKRLDLMCVCLVVVSASAPAQDATPADRLRHSADHLTMLARFEEPSIDSRAAGVTVIRVIVWPTFESPVSIRVEARGDQYQLTAKRLRGHGGYGPGPVDQVKHRQLRRVQWQHLQKLLADAGFWSMAPEDERFRAQPDGSVTVCLDGTTWMVEAAGGGRSHAAQRYCPDEGSFTAIGRYLVNLSNVGVDDRRL